VYLSFFNLREAPFNLTPDPRFLFLSPQHEEALSSLLYGIYERKGFIEITGEVGVGKTVLCRALLDRLDDTVSTALIFNSYLNRMELLQAITSDFGLKSQEIAHTGTDYIAALNTYLLQECATGRNAVVILDEAQNLEPTVLEQLRMLSNLETERGKLLQVVLVGQPELRDKLASPHMRQLEQRIAVRFHIHEFTRTDTVQYIVHRMSIAGAANTVTFTRRALYLIHQYSGGLPRRINLLCDRVLMTAFVKETHRITATIVRQSVQDLTGTLPLARALRPRQPVLRGLVLGSLLGFGVVSALSHATILSTLQEHIWPAIRQPILAWLQSPTAPPTPQPAPPPPPPVPTPEALPAALPPQPPPVSENDLALARTLWRVKTQAEALLTPSQNVRAAGWEVLLANAARPAGLDIMPMPASVWQLRDITRPCFLEIRLEPTALQSVLWVLVKGQEEGVLIYQEPEGLAMVSLQQVRGLWDGLLYLTADTGSYRGVTLRQGMHGERVHILQQALKTLGYFAAIPSGQFDGETQQAVKRFQRNNQLLVDGHAGPQTLMLLLHFRGGVSEHTT
jgi:general secretion pathway protein A